MSYDSLSPSHLEYGLAGVMVVVQPLKSDETRPPLSRGENGVHAAEPISDPITDNPAPLKSMPYLWRPPSFRQAIRAIENCSLTNLRRPAGK